jgi:transposase InsO family protein
MSEKSADKPPSAAVEAVVKAGAEVDVQKNASKSLKEKFDPVFQAKLNKLYLYKFKDESDLIARFPFKDELEEEDGVYMWHEYIVLSQDQVPYILKAEWANLPNNTGRIKYNSYLKQRYIGVSSPQIIAFLEANDEHQLFRQRRRSQRTRNTIAPLPFHTISSDLTDLPKRVGIYKCLYIAVDSFTKWIWCTPLKNKDNTSIVRAITAVYDSLPPGAKVKLYRVDNGTEQKNEAIKSLLESHGTKQVFSLPGNPLGNAIAETTVRVTKTALFSELNNDQRSGSFVPALRKTIKQLNQTQSSATGFIPAQLFSTELPANVIKAVLDRLQENAKGTDVNKRYQFPLVAGDKVRIAVEELLNKTRLLVKSGKYKPSHEATFSQAIFTVVKQTADNFVTVAERPGEKFTRGGCLKVPQDAKDLSKEKIGSRKEQGGVEEEDAAAVIPGTKKRKQQTDFVEPTRVLRSKVK